MKQLRSALVVVMTVGFVLGLAFWWHSIGSAVPSGRADSTAVTAIVPVERHDESNPQKADPLADSQEPSEEEGIPSDRDVDALTRACDQGASEEELASTLATLSSRLLAGDETLANVLRNAVAEKHGSIRSRCFLCLLLGILGAQTDLALLRDTAISGDEALGLAALKALVLLRSNTIEKVREHGNDLVAFWRDAFDDYALQLRASPARSGRSASYQGGSSRLPPSAWREVNPWSKDPEVLSAIMAVAASECPERVRVVALGSYLPRSHTMDAFVKELLRETNLPPLVRALAYEDLSHDRSNWECVVEALEHETHPRVLRALLTDLNRLTSSQRSAETLAALRRLFSTAPSDDKTQMAILQSISILDTADSVLELDRIARDPSAGARRALALQALLTCPLNSPTAPNRVRTIRDLAWDPDPNLSACAAAGLLYSQHFPSLRDRSTDAIDDEFLSRVQTLIMSPAINDTMREGLKVGLANRGLENR